MTTNETNPDESSETWLSVTFACLMSVCILSTIVGNILVVLSIFTYKPLRGVQNFYIVSLACADLAVAIFVMPFNVANAFVGHWQFGAVFCNAWLTFDVFTCTASILNLCAIAVDRYYAIHDPINYAQKRTLFRVLLGIFIAWLASAIISIPPLFGWNNSSGNSTSLYNAVNRTCQLTDEVGYVLYSASGSFYIPLVVMAFVYFNIFIATRARLRARAQLSPGSTASQRRQQEKRKKGKHREKDCIIFENGNVDVVQKGEINEAAQNVREELRNGKNKDVVVSLANPTTLCIDHVNPDVAVASAIAATPLCDETRTEINTRTGDVQSLSNVNTSVDDPTNKKTVVLEANEQTPLRVQSSLHESANSRKNGHVSNNLSVPKLAESFLIFSRRFNFHGTPSSAAGVRIASPDRKRILRPHRSSFDSSTMTHGSQMSQFLEEKQRISLSKERRAARTMGIIMGAFVLCWLPFFLMYVIFPFCEVCKETDKRVVNFIVWLGYINSTLNPIIYTVFNIDFRRAFTSLLHGSCRTNT